MDRYLYLWWADTCIFDGQIPVSLMARYMYLWRTIPVSLTDRYLYLWQTDTCIVDGQIPVSLTDRYLYLWRTDTCIFGQIPVSLMDRYLYLWWTDTCIFECGKDNKLRVLRDMIWTYFILFVVYLSTRSGKPTAHFNVVSRLGMHGAVSPSYVWRLAA